MSAHMCHPGVAQVGASPHWGGTCHPKQVAAIGLQTNQNPSATSHCSYSTTKKEQRSPRGSHGTRSDTAAFGSFCSDGVLSMEPTPLPQPLGLVPSTLCGCNQGQASTSQA
eukprot:5085557-Amphidinium_carterae.1